MRVLCACEESQRVCVEFRNLGHEAYSCDLIECSGNHPEWHIMQDVIPLLNGNCSFETMDGINHKIDSEWDLIIAFPTCTYLTHAGTRHFSPRMNSPEKIDARMKLRLEAADFFMKFINASCYKIAVENPVGYMNTTYRKPDQIIQPYDLSGSDCNMETMNDIDITYRKKDKKYLLGIETAYIFKDGKDESIYLNKCLSAFTKFMNDNSFKTDAPYLLFMSNLCIDMSAETIEDLYTKFRIFVEGFCKTV